MATIEQARAARDKLIAQHPSVSAGVTKVGSEYAIKANVSSTAERDKLPEEVDGVVIVSEVVGQVTKR